MTVAEIKEWIDDLPEDYEISIGIAEIEGGEEFVKLIDDVRCEIVDGNVLLFEDDEEVEIDEEDYE